MNTVRFGKAHRKAIADELKKQLPQSSQSDRDLFLKRAESNAGVVTQERDTTSTRDAKRAIASMQRGLAQLRKAHASSGVEVQEWLRTGLRVGGYSEFESEHYFANLAVLESTLQSVEELYRHRRRSVSGGSSELLVCFLAKDWEECFGRKPTATLLGPFDSVVQVVHRACFGCDLNRRRLLEGLRLPRPRI